MSNSPSRRVKYVTVGIFVVLSLAVAALLFTSYLLSMSLQETAQAVETVAAQAATAQAKAETAIARVDDLAARAASAPAPTPAPPPTPTPTPTVAPTGPRIPLAGGIRLTSGSSTTYHVVDDWRVYGSYEDFESSWPGSAPAMAWLILQEVEGEPDKWLAFRASNAQVLTPTEWSDFSLLMRRTSAQIPGDLTFDEGPTQTVISATLFSVNSQAPHILRSSMDAFRRDTRVKLGESRTRTRLLLADRSDGKKTTLILVVILPETGAGDDPWTVWGNFWYTTYGYQPYPFYFMW